MVKKILISLFILGIMIPSVKAADFLDTSAPRRQITVGVRAGINTSSQGINFEKIFSNIKSANTDWRAGFDVGAVVNLNIKNYFTLQPGFFFVNKSYNSNLVKLGTTNGTLTMLSNQFEHSRFYYFQVPILASFRFNLTNDLKWLVDFGPYIALGLGGNTKVEAYSAYVLDAGSNISYNEGKHDFFGDANGNNLMMKSFDWGFKMGTGIMFRNRYSLSLYYSNGCKNVAQSHSAYLNQPNVKNKQWSLTFGYDF